ncbi:uncharacterized protein VTP21DRAFT_9003 [Calcarisporiella thermophila]|uniref:uncharacterized protein n=1 Tax=Calcarisporiella thermophila TaxID=911321 RepID=UPI003742D7B1
MTIYLLDYGAGNVRSLANAVHHIGYDFEWVKDPSDISKAEKLIFPGVGAFAKAMDALTDKGYVPALRDYIASGKPYMGICVGMQTLFESSEESPATPGLGILPGCVKRLSNVNKSVPHMGWNTCKVMQRESYAVTPDRAFYFVHSYAVPSSGADWELGRTKYGDEEFVSAVRWGNVFCTQFHPEKSGFAGLRVLRAFLRGDAFASEINTGLELHKKQLGLTKRIIACLDVRANDQGDLVVTKGDQYDVREKTGDGEVRNLGKPVELAKRYFDEGADEIAFLNITSFRECPLRDMPMLEVLRQASKEVFVPLTIGGGIRDVIDPDGTKHPALEVAAEYFRSGADKVSIGSDAVYAAEEYWNRGGKPTGDTAIESIASAYGSQAVVISVDPKRVYVKDPNETQHHCIKTELPGPNGEAYCWYQCTVKGGRESRDFDVRQLVTACEALGAGEILLNCMDRDGTNSGFDIELIRDVKAAVRIPVVASSGAGKVEHFSECFDQTDTEAALAAGIFHRREVPIEAVKAHLANKRTPVRAVDACLD